MSSLTLGTWQRWVDAAAVSNLGVFPINEWELRRESTSSAKIWAPQCSEPQCERILSVTFPGVHFPTFPEKLSKIISKCVEGWKHKWRGHTKNELEALWQALESWGLKNFLFSPEWAFLGNYAIKLLEVLNVHFKLLIFHLIWWCTKCSHNIVATTQTCKRVQQLCKVHMWPSWKKKVWNFSTSVK